VVRVVEEERERAARAALADPAHERGSVHSCTSTRSAPSSAEPRSSSSRSYAGCAGAGTLDEGTQRPLAVVADEVRAAPAVARLVHAHLVPAREQLGDDAAQEVRVAVVPVGGERVDEEDDPHQTRPPRPGRTS
jgi:hypothetical protein